MRLKGLTLGLAAAVAMTGVAAILRFPLQGLDDVDEESDVDSEEERINAIRAGRDPDASQQDEESKGGDKSQGSMSEIDSVLLGLVDDFDEDTPSVQGSIGRMIEDDGQIPEEEKKQSEMRDEKVDY